MMYSFWSIGRCCYATGSKTHGEVGFAVRGGKAFPLVMEARVRLNQEELGALPSAFIGLFATRVIYSNDSFDKDNKKVAIVVVTKVIIMNGTFNGTNSQ